MLEKVQMRAVTMVNGLADTYEEKLKALGMQSLEKEGRKLTWFWSTK
jgi:hypothetical protein